MSLCEIPTNDPKNPAYYDPTVVSGIKAAAIGSKAIYVFERGMPAGRLIETELTTREVVALLEAHKEAQEEQGRIYAQALMDRVAASGERTKRENILIAGLMRIAHRHLDDWLSTQTPATFAQEVLRDAGVADAEPETETPT